MKFKTEVTLLALAIVMFAASVFLYSYQTVAADATVLTTQSYTAYPYQGYALFFVGFGSISMVTASISFQKRSKNPLQ